MVDEKITLKLISRMKNYSVDGLGSIEQNKEILVSKEMALQLLRTGDFKKVENKKKVYGDKK